MKTTTYGRRSTTLDGSTTSGLGGGAGFVFLVATAAGAGGALPSLSESSSAAKKFDCMIKATVVVGTNEEEEQCRLEGAQIEKKYK